MLATVEEYFGDVTDTKRFKDSDLYVVEDPDNPVFKRIVAGTVEYAGKKDKLGVQFEERPAEDVIAEGNADAAADAVDAKNDFLLEATGRDAKSRRDSMKRSVEDDAEKPDTVWSTAVLPSSPWSQPPPTPHASARRSVRHHSAAGSVEQSGPVELLTADPDPVRRDDQLVVAFLHDVAADLPGDLAQLVDDVFDGPILRAKARDVRDDEIPVVHRVLDRDDVFLAVDLRDVHGHARLAGVRIEVVRIQLNVILGGAAVPTEDLIHESHTVDTNPPRS